MYCIAINIICTTIYHSSEENMRQGKSFAAFVTLLSVAILCLLKLSSANLDDLREDRRLFIFDSEPLPRLSRLSGTTSAPTTRSSLLNRLCGLGGGHPLLHGCTTQPPTLHPLLDGALQRQQGEQS